jgi:hypothetical protein
MEALEQVPQAPCPVGAGRAGLALVSLVADLAGADPYAMYVAMTRADAVADLFADFARGVAESGEAMREEGRLPEAEKAALAALETWASGGGARSLGALHGEFARMFAKGAEEPARRL